MSNDYKGLRSMAEQVKRKVNNAENITSGELDTLRRYAQANGHAANLAAFALGKKLVQESEGGE